MGDWATARLAGVLWGSEIGWIALALSTGSAWQWFCSTRTFANSLETVITAVALSVWPWSLAVGARGGHQRGELRLSLLLAAFACILRPTNILVWSVLGVFAVGNNKSHQRSILIWEAVWIGWGLFYGFKNLLISWVCSTVDQYLVLIPWRTVLTMESGLFRKSHFWSSMLFNRCLNSMDVMSGITISAKVYLYFLQFSYRLVFMPFLLH